MKVLTPWNMEYYLWCKTIFFLMLSQVLQQIANTLQILYIFSFWCRHDIFSFGCSAPYDFDANQFPFWYVAPRPGAAYGRKRLIGRPNVVTYSWWLVPYLPFLPGKPHSCTRVIWMLLWIGHVLLSGGRHEQMHLHWLNWLKLMIALAIAAPSSLASVPASWVAPTVVAAPCNLALPLSSR